MVQWWQIVVGAGFLCSDLAAQDPRLKERLDSTTTARVTQLVDSARRSNLPTEPLVLKALEGHSKGASGERIIAAVGALLDALGTARAGLGSGSTADELSAGALWIRGGGDAAGLSVLRRAGPGRSLGVALAVSTEVMSRGFSRTAAVETTAALLGARLSDAEFMAFRDRVDRAVRQGSRFDTAIQNEVARVRANRREP
jgi:hypothetical protein